MDIKQKTRVITFAFILFFVVAAFAISQGKDSITGTVTLETCNIACETNEDCNDWDKNTLDGCAYPGSCSSKCIHEKK